MQQKHFLMRRAKLHQMILPAIMCIAEIIGIENTILLHKHYRGQQITLPQRLYSVQYVVKEVERQLGTHSLSDLAKKYGYTERRLRQLIKEDSKL